MKRTISIIILALIPLIGIFFTKTFTKWVLEGKTPPNRMDRWGIVNLLMLYQAVIIYIALVKTFQ